MEEVIGRLQALGYLDDEAFARAWLGSRDRSRPRGRAALRRELQLKGLGAELVDAALEDRDREAAATLTRFVPPDSGLASGQQRVPVSADHAAALRLLERKHATLDREQDPRKRRQRAYALLARNGFDPGVCMEATSEFLADADAEDG